MNTDSSFVIPANVGIRAFQSRNAPATRKGFVIRRAQRAGLLLIFVFTGSHQLSIISAMSWMARNRLRGSRGHVRSRFEAEDAEKSALGTLWHFGSPAATSGWWVNQCQSDETWRRFRDGLYGSRLESVPDLLILP
jgi:hypothetical protein